MTATDAKVLAQTAKLLFQLSLEAKYNNDHGAGRPADILNHPGYGTLIAQSEPHILRLEKYQDQGGEDQQVFAALREVLTLVTANLRDPLSR